MDITAKEASVKDKKNARIDYVDLMKGICITLVVIMHCNVMFPLEIINNMLQNLRMPLYFFLTGLFFKEYSCFSEFIIRKTNKIIIPYVFFAFIPYIFFDFFFNSEINKTYLYYLFVLIEPYNFPLWFLRSLFISYIFFYLTYRFTKRYGDYMCGIVIFLLSYISWRISYVIPRDVIGAYLIENIVTSVFVLPFLYVAFISRKKGLLTMNFTWKKFAIIFILGFIAWELCVQNNVSLMKAHLVSKYPLLYISAFGGIACLWVICAKIQKLFFFSYVGRYSIIVLGTHIPISKFISTYLGITNYFQAIITLALMPVMIYICIRFFPNFTAQKDLIRYR